MYYLKRHFIAFEHNSLGLELFDILTHRRNRMNLLDFSYLLKLECHISLSPWKTVELLWTSRWEVERRKVLKNNFRVLMFLLVWQNTLGRFTKCLVTGLLALDESIMDRSTSCWYPRSGLLCTGASPAVREWLLKVVTSRTRGMFCFLSVKSPMAWCYIRHSGLFLLIMML